MLRTMEALETFVTPSDVRAARDVIHGRLHRTPTTRSAYLSAVTGLDIHLKLELFQKTGSFKPRGVLNNIHHLVDAEKRAGVISLSAGNHAQALAWAAHAIGVPATIVMPATAVQSKVDATRGYGGEVIQTNAPLMDTALEIQRARGLTLVHPFDNLNTIAGTGTVALEILEDVPDCEVIFAGCGGGGLLSGIAAFAGQTRPGIHVFGVEPDGALKMGPSVEAGHPVAPERLATIADGLAAPFVGAHNLRHVVKFVTQMTTVTDEEIIRAIRILMERCKVVAEPAGAASLAAALGGRLALTPGTVVCCVISGGNVDLAKLKSLL